MWRYLALLLGSLLLASSSVAQYDFPGPPPPQPGVFVPDGYLPPIKTPEICLETETQTTVLTRRVEDTTTVSRPGSRSTVYVTITQPRPTTVYSTQFSTIYTTIFDRQTITSTRYITSIVRENVGDRPVTVTSIFTTTVPMYVENTRYITDRSSNIVTRTTIVTQVRESFRPTTLITTQLSVVTSRVVIPGPDVTRTTVRITSSQLTTTVQQRPTTVTITRASTTNIVRTTTIRPPPVQVTRTMTTTVFRTSTVTTTIRDVSTRVQRVTSSSIDFVTVTRTNYQTITRQVIITSRSQYISATTITSTVRRPTTVFEDDIQTVTMRGRPVFRTVTQTSTTTVRGIDGGTFTSTRFSTTFSTLTTTTSRGTPGQTIFRTQFERETCGGGGYRYTEPATKFSFP